MRCLRGSRSKFLSTPSARRATRSMAEPTSRVGFLSTPSARRATFISWLSLAAEQGFLSTPSARRATALICFSFFRTGFLSTPSARRATAKQSVNNSVIGISIHALREEGDARAGCCWQPPRGISIHALREEGDVSAPGVTLPAPHFYPRPPRGGRRILACGAALAVQISIHALREEGDDIFCKPCAPGCKFLSTPSARRATSAFP